MDWKNLNKSKTFRRVIIGIGSIAVALLIFEAGIFVGYKKASFSYRLADNYYRGFRGGQGMPMMAGIDQDDMPTSHGAAGKIIKISLPTIIIDDKDGIEKTILIKDDTVIRRFQDTLSPQDIRPDEFAVVIGAPNTQSQIQARFIRLLPPPSEELASSTIR